MTDVSQKGGVRKPQITHKTKKCTKFLKSRELAQIKKCTVFNHGAVFNLKDKKTFRCCRLVLGASVSTHCLEYQNPVTSHVIYPVKWLRHMEILSLSPFDFRSFRDLVGCQYNSAMGICLNYGWSTCP